jgi:hypothetical protein
MMPDWPPLQIVRIRAMLVFLIAVSLSPIALYSQDPLKTLPNNYRSIFDNPDVTVIRAHYGPHEKIPIHDHAAVSTVFIYLNDSSPVRIDHDGDKAFSVVRPPTVTGSFRVVAGMAERHSIENLGDKSSEFLRIELKQVSFPSEEAFRGSAPQNLRQSFDAIEFKDAGVQIERIVCAAVSNCSIKPTQAPSLLVALTALSVVANEGQQKEVIEAGAVHWLPSSQAATVIPNIGDSAHLLRIILPMDKVSGQKETKRTLNSGR